MRTIAALVVVAGCFAASAVPAIATGTLRVQHRDGVVQTYTNVYIRILDNEMTLTSNDGKGTVVIGKAACSKIGELISCLPYDATLEQNGNEARIALQSGTVLINPTATRHALSYSSQSLPSHGVLMAVKTKS
ncbi:MAG TPA: hypothetical protein VK760_05360, partial [Candidatus Acidoferrales bacterium]|nr:hypothetical protein [Candidatus Acidoferrales bacterium]